MSSYYKQYPLIKTPQHTSVAARNYKLYETLLAQGYWVEPRFREPINDEVKMIDYLIVAVGEPSIFWDTPKDDDCL